MDIVVAKQSSRSSMVDSMRGKRESQKVNNDNRMIVEHQGMEVGPAPDVRPSGMIKAINGMQRGKLAHFIPDPGESGEEYLDEVERERLMLKGMPDMKGVDPTIGLDPEDPEKPASLVQCDAMRNFWTGIK